MGCAAADAQWNGHGVGRRPSPGTPASDGHHTVACQGKAELEGNYAASCVLCSLAFLALLTHLISKHLTFLPFINKSVLWWTG